MSAQHTPAWVVLTNPGTDCEAIAGEFTSKQPATALLRDLQAAGDHADLMKRRADGTLTTEL